MNKIFKQTQGTIYENNGALYDEEWPALRERLKKYNAKWHDGELDQQAKTNIMATTALMGNGDVGANSAGSHGEKSYLISKIDFWTCGDLGTNAVTIPHERRTGILSAGGVTIRCPNKNINSDEADQNEEEKVPFYEELDIASGVLTTKMVINGVPVTLCSWVSASENVMVTEITSGGTERVDLEAAVWTRSDLENYYPRKAGTAGNSVWASKKTENFVQDQNPDSWTSEVVISAFLLHAEAETRKVSDHEAALYFSLLPGQTVQLVTAVGGGGKNYDWHGKLQTIAPMTEAQNLLKRFQNEESLTELKEEHDTWWKNYWLRSYIDIGNELIHRYYYGSLYYMACTSREDTLPPGLYGIWITTDGAMWNGDYHMNYNFIAPFYGMYSSNRCEFAKCLKRPLLDFMNEGEKRARHLEKIVEDYIVGGKQLMKKTETLPHFKPFVKDFQDGTFPGRPDLVNGIEDAVLYPVSLGPWGSSCWDDGNGGYLTQVSNAGYAAMGLTAYYNYTKDKAYLQEIYPFLEKNLNFYEKWCEKEVHEDGSYRYNIWSGAHEKTFELNYGTVLGIIRNMISCVLDGVKDGAVNPPAEKITVWKDMYDHLAKYPVEPCFKIFNYDKPVLVLGEAGLQYVPGLGADVGLEFIVPCEQMSFDSDPSLMEAVKNVIEMRTEQSKENWFHVCNFPKCYPNAIRSGFDPKFVIEIFEENLKRCMQENYTVRDGCHGIEKAGALNAVNGMLLQGDHGIMKVFPNWIGEDASFARLREHGAFLVSSAMKNGKVTYIEITSEKGGKAEVVNPWKHARVTDAQGKNIAFAEGKTRNTHEDTIIVNTCAGDIFIIEEDAACHE